jgi:hypothetical protein
MRATSRLNLLEGQARTVCPNAVPGGSCSPRFAIARGVSPVAGRRSRTTDVLVQALNEQDPETKRTLALLAQACAALAQTDAIWLTQGT